jgi:hypothetical protein
MRVGIKAVINGYQGLFVQKIGNDEAVKDWGQCIRKMVSATTAIKEGLPSTIYVAYIT